MDSHGGRFAGKLDFQIEFHTFVGQGRKKLDNSQNTEPRRCAIRLLWLVYAFRSSGSLVPPRGLAYNIVYGSSFHMGAQKPANQTRQTLIIQEKAYLAPTYKNEKKKNEKKHL